MQFQKSVKHEEQTRRYSIAATDGGWEVREEHNGAVVKRVQHHDWHRVERARRTITIELAALRNEGWRDEA